MALETGAESVLAPHPRRCPRNPHHEPGLWTPYISLARRLRPGQEALAAQAVGEVVAGGMLSGACSYDSETRTVIPVRG
jgi:hypothetical protein